MKFFVEKKGKILYNNTIINNSIMKNVSSYLYQDDVVLEHLTLLEHMMFMVRSLTNLYQIYLLILCFRVL